MQAKPFQFVLGQAHDCDYIPGRKAKFVFLATNPEHAKNEYADLIRQGFRRSGDLIYRPCCGECRACVPVRVPVEYFRPSRSQSRTWKMNTDLKVIDKPPRFNRVHFELYRRYLDARHPGGSMCEGGPEDYIRFLSSDWAGTEFYEFQLRDRVVAVAVVDRLDAADALSAVYTFFDPELSSRSLGSYAILWEIQRARQLGLRFLYLGYWISACAKMAYKNAYRPIEGLLNGRWQFVNDE